MSDNENVKTGISVDQLNNIYNTTGGTPDSEIELCFSGREVFIKPLKIKDKKDLLKAIETKNEDIVNKKLDEIIIKYVEPKDGGNIDFDELTSNERQQILVYIRIAAGGNSAKIVHQCPSCESINKNIEYDLENLYLKEFNVQKEELIVPLSNKSIKIELSPVTRKVERQIDRYVRNNKIKAMTERQMCLVAGHIKDVWIETEEGEQKVEFKNIEQKIEFFDSLNGVDATNVMEVMNKCLDFGIKMPFHFKCDSCEYESEEEVNVAAFFIS